MIKERFKEVREVLNLTQKEMASKMHKGMTVFQGYESGRKNITGGVLLDLQDIFNVNINWMRTGEGSMFLSDTEKELSKIENRLNTSSHFVEIREFPTVKASAGYGCIINEEVSIPYYVNAGLVSNKEVEMVISVTGNSMSPTLEENDKILISSDFEFTSKPQINKIYVIHTDNAVYVKRYKQKKGNEYIFSSDNKEYGNIALNINNSADRIIGKVKAILCRDFN